MSSFSSCTCVVFNIRYFLIRPIVVLRHTFEILVKCICICEGVIAIETENSYCAMSRGESETARLKQQMQSQLDRLLDQLEDLEANKEEMEEAEYDETKNDTLDQVVN